MEWFSIIWLNTPNVEALGHPVTQFNCNVTIDVAPFNDIRSSSPYSQLGWVVHSLQDFLAGSVVVLTALPISTEQVVINALFSMLSNRLPIGDERNVQEHVSTKSQGTRRGTERRHDGGSHRVCGLREGHVNSLLSLSNVERRVCMYENAEDVSYRLIHSLTNRIRLWIFTGGWYILDAESF